MFIAAAVREPKDSAVATKVVGTAGRAPMSSAETGTSALIYVTLSCKRSNQSALVDDVRFRSGGTPTETCSSKARISLRALLGHHVALLSRGSAHYPW